MYPLVSPTNMTGKETVLVPGYSFTTETREGMGDGELTR
jgi:hypothetical protein